MKKNILAFMVLSLLLIMTYFSPAMAATIWCNPGNTGTEDGLSKSTGYNTLWEAMAAMAPNDTVIIANGDWHNTADMYINASHKPPDGTGGNYSKVHAETDWEVKLPYIHIETAWPTNQGYLEFRGIVFDNKYIGSGTTHFSYNMHHTKFIRCGFLGHGLTDNAPTTGFGNSDSSDLSKNQYNLMEECIAWGTGRYVFLSWYGQKNIFRRCIARHDKVLGSWSQIANFRGYGSDNLAYQNCISIDSDRYENFETTPLSTETSGFWVGDQVTGDSNEITGCISIKDLIKGFYISGKGGHASQINNSIVLDLQYESGGHDSTMAFIYSTNITCTIQNCLGMTTNQADQDGFTRKGGSTSNVYDSIIKDVHDVGLSVDTATNLNHFNAGQCSSPSDWGTDSISYDPEKNGLLYPVRIEEGSTLAIAGSGGGVCGPTILKKIGVSGTLYGETGWDTVIDENLWPFPNETKIKELMKETVDGVSGQYGFCAGDQTLTEYIWGYLGNTLPPFNVQAAPGNEKVTLTWDANTYDSNITGYKVYAGTASGTYNLSGYVGGKNVGDTTEETITGLTNDVTYYFVVTAVDSVKGESGYSYEASATPPNLLAPTGLSIISIQ